MAGTTNRKPVSVGKGDRPLCHTRETRKLHLTSHLTKQREGSQTYALGLWLVRPTSVANESYVSHASLAVNSGGPSTPRPVAAELLLRLGHLSARVAEYVLPRPLVKIF